MKPYGLPRNQDVAFPDVADIRTYGRKSSVGKLPGKGGDFRGYCRPASKAAARRRFARIARAEGRRACQEHE